MCALHAMLNAVKLLSRFSKFLFLVHFQVFYYFQVYGILSFVCIVLSMITTPAGQICGNKASIYLHEQLLNGVMKQSLNFFQTTPLGRVMNRFSNDITVIDKVNPNKILIFFKIVPKNELDEQYEHIF